MNKKLADEDKKIMAKQAFCIVSWNIVLGKEENDE